MTNQSRLALLLVTGLVFVGTASLGGALPASTLPPSGVLRPVFFVSDTLAPGLHLFSPTLIAGNIDGEKADKLLAKSRELPKITSTYLHAYAWRPTGPKEIGLVEEKDVIIETLVIADLDQDSKGEVIYYTPVFEPDKVKGAFVVLRRQGDQWKREVHPISIEAQPATLTAGTFFDPKRTAMAIDVAWWMPEDPEYAYDDVMFFTWDGKGFRQGPKVRLQYDVMSLVAWDLTGDRRDELLVLGDKFHSDDKPAEGEPLRGCPLEVYGYTPVEGVKRLAQYTVPLEECSGSLVLLRALGRSYLLLVQGSKIYEVTLPQGTATQTPLELRATLHMGLRSVTVGDIDGDGDQELLISAMKFVQGKPEHGFFIYKFFPQ